jgi:hypothetical protein
LAIDCDSFVGLTSIGPTRKAIKHRLHPAGRCWAELKNCAASKISTEHCRSINVTGTVRFQIGIGVFAFIFFTAKDDVRRRRGGRGQREDKNRSRCNGSDPGMSRGFHGDYCNKRRLPRQERFAYITSFNARLRRQAFLCDQFHLIAEAIKLAERGINVGRNANTLEFFVHDRRGKDVVFVE